ncbi:hypothetical protein SAMN05421595_2206 [Austwickia chelonae]|uniref:Nitroreductase domain-containing protein n=1 Tax=Austwickia chelonae NBRC 105200 TaxID=1184607 RepID=K6W5H2_9MICO|nr:hypothetical protein [Austwickia chelonae]GAB77067.1 hypothetical protein AUCHE_04_01080 [Austwickia chelonae NBRC 105200]SEW33761.1 hypothetical protein SAMN05421595_2206 [Austwickia chelonae]
MTGVPASRALSVDGVVGGLLAGAFDARDPGGPRPPGPRATRWSGPGLSPSGQARIPVGRWLRELLYSSEFHRDAQGRPMSTPLRAVPSAGGCQPVTAHVICGAGCDLPPGVYAFQCDTGDFVARYGGRPPVGVQGAGPPVGAEVVFSVLPQRPWGRYVHRYPPLLVADTAFAVCWLGVLAEQAGVSARWLPDASGAAAALGLPGYRRWVERWPGSAPELMTARVVLGGGVDGVRPDPLCASVVPVPDEERRPHLLPGLSEEVLLPSWREPVCVAGDGWLPALAAARLVSRRSADPWGSSGGVDGGGRAGVPSWVGGLVDRVAGVFASSPCRPRVTAAGDPFRAGLSARCSGQRWVEDAPVLVDWTVSGSSDVPAEVLLGRAEVHWVAAMEAAALTVHVHAGRAEGAGSSGSEGRAEGAGPSARASSRVVAGWTSDGSVPPVLALAIWP